MSLLDEPLPAMKKMLYAQFHPVKTLRQIVYDRNLYRTLAVLAFLVAL